MIEQTINELHIHEKKVLKALNKLGGKATPEEIAKLKNMDIKQVMSAAGALNSKDIIKVHKNISKVETLTEKGEKVAKTIPEGEWTKYVSLEGEFLPERYIHMKAFKQDGKIPLSDIPLEYKPGIGGLKQKNYAIIDKGYLSLTDIAVKATPNNYPEENLIQIISEKKEIPNIGIPVDLLDANNILKKKKEYLNFTDKKEFKFEILTKGRQIIDHGFEIKEEATQITHEQLKSGSWRNLHYRAYDIKAEHPESFAGKLHPLQRTIEEIRRIFLNLGFTESRGTILESAFWNFDCLFQPQDHAAREMQDTFYIKTPRETLLPDDELVEKVKNAHEHGGRTGSKGWKYQWDREVARQSVLRTHTTCVSARFLKDNQPPLKMFSVGRVFRRETITYKHLPEFHQVEGIVADESITFRNLLGILKEFYHQLGFQVRFRPAYFPYTYLSTECEIYLPEKESWIELGGAGMFRPEVLEPLGVETPVAAFGLGIERLAMIRLGIKDIRMLYQSDIGWLRELPVTHSVEWDEI